MPSKLIEQFGQPINRVQAFKDRYQYYVSIIATFLFFSDLPDYLFAAPILPSVIPLVWLVAFAISTLPFIHKVKTMPKPLLLWMGLYLLIATLSLMTVSADEISFTDYRAKVLAVLFIACMYATYQQKSLTHVKYTIVFVLLMTVGNTLFELLNPKFFTELNLGRPAGFYIDPNKTGCATMLGMLFGISAIKKQYRWILVIIAAIGIMATFSRGAILGWLICVSLLIAGKVLSEKRWKIVVPAIILIVMLVSLNPLRALTDYFKGGPDAAANWDIVNRLEEFQNPSSKEDSAMERQAVAAGGWLYFSNHPFWGNGLASTRKWSIADVSTHNMYLYFMADHGIIGVIFLPGAVLGVVYGNRGEDKTIILCFAIFISLWGFFSHEVLAERYILTIFALMAAMNTNQKWYLKYQNRNLLLAPSIPMQQLRLPPARNEKIIPQNRN